MSTPRVYVFHSKIIYCHIHAGEGLGLVAVLQVQHFMGAAALLSHQ